MSANSSSRRQKLEAFLAAHPANSFGRYGLAMECVREGDSDGALEHFRLLLESHPDYVVGYFHYGQLLAKLGREEQARAVLEAGIVAAENRGDAHAVSEMRGALDALA